MSWGQGEQVSDYVVEGVLGGGAMAVVYAARHRLLGTQHAIKVLSLDTPAMRLRLRREAAAHTRLDHPNLVPVRDLIEADSGPAVVMPLVRGPTLQALLASRPLEADEGIALFRGIVAGVRHAHAAGVVHCDLKPGNVLLDTERGSVVPRVTDFGLARLAGELAQDERIGTPGYSAPEQRLDPTSADHRADLYALGCVLYELLTGQRAFPDPLAPARRNPVALAPRWSQLVDALLQPSPEQRPSVDDLVSELGESPTLPWLGPGSPLARDTAQATPALLVSAPSPASEAPAHNLEVERDELIGRDQELAALQESVRPGRLVTLVGPAGVGKTRLAKRFGHEALARSPGGVWWCALERARTERELVAELLDTLELPPGIGERLEGSLATFAGGVVVLDNLEQLEPATIVRLEALVASAPEVSFLGTSREPLGLAAEQVVSLAPLGQHASVRLFAERAAAAGVRLELQHEAVGDAVRRIVELLDGLPLALEIAAARVALVSLASLAEQLSGQLDARRPGEGPDRQRTLRAALDASWQLLEPWERAAFAQLSVFEGGFTLAAADAVLGPDARPPEGWVERAVERLIRRSLVRIEEAGAVVRYGMLTTVAVYARERLADLGGGRAAEARHGQWFARDGRAWLEGPDLGLGEAQRRLERGKDRANLLVAARRALRRGDDDVAVHAALGALVVMCEQGPFDAAGELGEAVLPLAPEGVAREHLLVVTAKALGLAQDLDRAAEMTQEALESARRAGHVRAELRALLVLGEIESKRALNRAEQLLEALRARAVEVGAPLYEARALEALASMWIEADRPQDAERATLRAMELLGELGEPDSVLSLRLLASCRGQMGQIESALELAQLALQRAQQQRDQFNEAKLHNTLGNLAHVQQRWEDNERHLLLSIQLNRRIGNDVGLGAPLFNLGEMYTKLGRFEEARALHIEGLEVARRTGDQVSAAAAAFALGFLASNEGHDELAIEHYRHSIALAQPSDRGQTGFTRANLATVLVRQGQLEEAHRQGELALTELAGSPSALPYGQLLFARILDAVHGSGAGDPLLEQVLQQVPAGLVRGHALMSLARSRLRAQRPQEGRVLAEEAAEYASSPYERALALSWAAIVAAHHGDGEPGRRVIDEIRAQASTYDVHDELKEALEELERSLSLL